jgi:hypothetical protein
MYPIKLSFMIQLLLVFTCEIQTSKADESESQENLLRESFKVQMNDSENFLTLQKIFLTPRQKDPNGVYLYVYVTVEGRITGSDDDQYRSYLIDEYCDNYNYNNYSCVYHTLMTFEILPPAANQDSTVKILLNKRDITSVLRVLDPSFYNLARMLQSLDDYYDTSDLGLSLYTYVDKIELGLPTDVRNALYLTLSWVSLCNVILD